MSSYDKRSLQLVWLAALFGLREKCRTGQLDKAAAAPLWGMLWDLWKEIGHPPAPITAPWVDKYDFKRRC